MNRTAVELAKWSIESTTSRRPWLRVSRNVILLKFRLTWRVPGAD